MYFLKKNSILKESYDATQEIREKTLELISDSTAGLVFEPDEHRYFLGSREMRSVSSIVEHFAPFDKYGVAERCSANPRHEMYGKSVEEIIALWEESGRTAAAEGTKVHAFGEACYLYLIDREEEMEEKFRQRITPEGLEALTPKEAALAAWWDNHDWKRFVPIAKETRIVNPALGYAGTFDLLLYDKYNFTLYDKDYKTNKDLDKWYGEMCIPPLSMIKANDIGKYTIQQTLYTIALRNLSLCIGANNLIWLREDGYEERQLELGYDKVIEFAVREYLKTLN